MGAGNAANRKSGAGMGLLEAIRKRKTEEDNGEDVYRNGLEERLVKAGIPYDYAEEDGPEEAETIVYLDPFDTAVFRFRCGDDGYSAGDKTFTEEEAYRAIAERWAEDRTILDYIDDERYGSIFNIRDFYQQFVSDNGLHVRFFPQKDGKGLKLLYQFHTDPTERDYMIGVGMTAKENGVEVAVLPEGRRADAEAAAVAIFDKLYEMFTDYFKEGHYKVPEDSEFTDAVKTHMINRALVNRLNGIRNVEAHMVREGGPDKVFVLLGNNSAIDYASPTEQNPQGRMIVFDAGEEAEAADNAEFPVVQKVLSFTDGIADKPCSQGKRKLSLARGGRA